MSEMILCYLTENILQVFENGVLMRIFLL